MLGQIPYDSLSFSDPNVPEGLHTYGVTAVYGAPSPGESEPAEVSVDFILNSSDVKLPKAHIYPNPTNGSFVVEATGMERITVVNMLGKVVFDKNLTLSNQFAINARNWDAGIYSVIISSASGTINKRISIIR